MKVTMIKSVPPPQPPPQIEKVILELTVKEARMLSRWAGVTSGANMLNLIQSSDYLPMTVSSDECTRLATDLFNIQDKLVS